MRSAFAVSLAALSAYSPHRQCCAIPRKGIPMVSWRDSPTANASDFVIKRRVNRAFIVKEVVPRWRDGASGAASTAGQIDGAEMV